MGDLAGLKTKIVLHLEQGKSWIDTVSVAPDPVLRQSALQRVALPLVVSFAAMYPARALPLTREEEQVPPRLPRSHSLALLALLAFLFFTFTIACYEVTFVKRKLITRQKSPVNLRTHGRRPRK